MKGYRWLLNWGSVPSWKMSTIFYWPVRMPKIALGMLAVAVHALSYPLGGATLYHTVKPIKSCYGSLKERENLWVRLMS